MARCTVGASPKDQPIVCELPHATRFTEARQAWLDGAHGTLAGGGGGPHAQ